jgi:hypothetical protein
VGQVRLIGEIRDEAGYYLGDRLLYEANGVAVFRYSDNNLIDSCSTDYGLYGFEVPDPDTYTLKTWVVPTVVESVGPVTCEARSCEIPDTLVLAGHGVIHTYPNPFVPSDGGMTSISFVLEEAGPIQVSVLGVDRRPLRDLAEGSHPAGTHVLSWDGRDDQGAILPPGPYWVVLRTGGAYRYVLTLIEETG